MQKVDGDVTLVVAGGFEEASFWRNFVARRWLLSLFALFVLVAVLLSLPSKDSLLYNIIHLENGCRVQLRASVERKFVRTDRSTGRFLLTESRPWLQGSTFRVVKQDGQECFQLKSSHGSWAAANVATGEVAATALSQSDATFFVAIDPADEPYLGVSPQSQNPGDLVRHRHRRGRALHANSGVVSMKLKLCSRSVWLSVGESSTVLEHRDNSLDNNHAAAASASASSLRLTVRLSASPPTPSYFGSNVLQWFSWWSERAKGASLHTFDTVDSQLHPSIFEVQVLRQVRGVNLGGWFIPEVWMSPAFYNDTGLGWGGSLCAIVRQNHSLAERRMREVIENFMAEKDFAEIASMGLNSVRLPIGYWNVMADPYKKYAPADHRFSLHYIDWCFDMAEKYGLTVLLDLHGGPGSQNGIDHSGCGMEPTFVNATNVRLGLQAVEAMAARYGKRPSLLGFELLNEPGYMSELSNHSVLLSFYSEAYDVVRAHSADCLVVFNELYDQFYHTWDRDLLEPKFYNVVIDLHLYDWQLPYTKEPQSQHVRDAVNWKALLDTLSSTRPAIIGEWCMSTGTWRQAGQPFVNAAVKSFDRSAGWYIWNWKIQRGIGFDEWDVQFQHSIKGGLDPLQVYSKYDFVTKVDGQ